MDAMCTWEAMAMREARCLGDQKGKGIFRKEIEDVGVFLVMEFVSCIPEVSVEVQG